MDEGGTTKRGTTKGVESLSTIINRALVGRK